ncbi:hypothetical protein BaRGS_00011509 [Batillaria attramentaria]|uniref:Uncharacterized protein n=1 Tax=Batillaria attramentaria TaxID=370345 RepID=A0ABD0LD35_9CAEN
MATRQCFNGSVIVGTRSDIAQRQWQTAHQTRFTGGTCDTGVDIQRHGAPTSNFKQFRWKATPKARSFRAAAREKHDMVDAQILLAWGLRAGCCRVASLSFGRWRFCLCIMN